MMDGSLEKDWRGLRWAAPQHLADDASEFMKLVCADAKSATRLSSLVDWRGAR